MEDPDRSPLALDYTVLLGSLLAAAIVGKRMKGRPGVPKKEKRTSPGALHKGRSITVPCLHALLATERYARTYSCKGLFPVC